MMTDQERRERALIAASRLTPKQPPYTGGRWDDLELRVVDDVPDAEKGQGMTPDEIAAFLDRTIEPEEGQ